jgi:hypothetical protein
LHSVIGDNGVFERHITIDAGAAAKSDNPSKDLIGQIEEAFGSPEHHIRTTAKGVQIYVLRGKKSESPHDFIVKYREPGKRSRTPKHIHPIVEMYVKHAHDPQLTLRLRDHMLGVFNKVQPVTQFPPKLQVFTSADSVPFASLDAVGEFPVEFLMIVTELLFIQEKTNYPAGSLTQKLYAAFGVKDRFAVVSAATQGKIAR